MLKAQNFEYQIQKTAEQTNKNGSSDAPIFISHLFYQEPLQLPQPSDPLHPL